MSLRFLPLGLIALAACTTPPTPPPPVSGAPASGAPISGQCNAEAARGHVGKVATAATVEAARKDAGASTARTLKPDQMVTMEYMEGRLNVDVDARNVITRIRCG